MLRYYYLLCLFLAIKWSFCYEYISDNSLKYKYEQRPFRKDRIHHQKNRFEAKHNAHRRHPAYEIVDDKEPISQIDVASFIRKPDEYAVEDNYETESKLKSKPKLKIYDYYYGSVPGINIAEDVKRSDKRPYYLNPAAENSLNNNLFSFKVTITPRPFKSDAMQFRGNDNLKKARNSDTKPHKSNQQLELANTNIGWDHNNQKKCSIKHVKFPFFSSSRNESLKLKKDRKRKIFCFNCSKKGNKENESSTETRNIVKEAVIKEDPDSLISVNFNKENEENFLKIRDKRDNNNWMDDRERQIKELEEIQKKIDNVEISPIYKKIP